MGLFKIRRSGDERGIALVEFSFVVFPLVILFMGATDFTLFLQSYFSMNHVLREGVRYGAGMPQLEGGLWEVGKLNYSTSRHATLHQRMRLLTQAGGFNLQGGPTGVIYSSSCDPEPSGVGHTVTVSITGTYQSLLLGLIGISNANYTMSAEGPYLFAECFP